MKGTGAGVAAIGACALILGLMVGQLFLPCAHKPSRPAKSSKQQKGSQK